MTQSFITATSLRLPTEAEWEFACRASTTAVTYGVLNNIAWYGVNAGSTTHAVATKLPNALGLYDTIGNVWQYVLCLEPTYKPHWTSDWFLSCDTRQQLGGRFRSIVQSRVDARHALAR